MVGDKKPFIAALITLDPEAVPGWLERNGLPADTSLTELTTNPAIRAELEKTKASIEALLTTEQKLKLEGCLEAPKDGPPGN